MNEGKTKTRGRPAKPLQSPSFVAKAIIEFLQIFMIETLARRVVGLALIIAGVPNERIIELTGMSDRSIWNLKKAVNDGEIDNLFVIRNRSGRPGKAKDIESAIIEELERNNYHTRQQVADMVHEKFGISMSVSAVGKLLKKTASGD